jgi:hypothetical protein
VAKHLIIIALASFALLIARPAAPAQAQTKLASVGGAWQVSMQGQGTGPAVKQTLAIAQKGAAISGTLKAPQGSAVPISGTVKGANIAFSLKRHTPDGDVTQEFAGTVAGDSITGTVTQGQFQIGWTAVRSKQQAAAR